MKKNRFAVILCLLAAGLASTLVAPAQVAGTQTEEAVDPALGISTLQLWPDRKSVV